MRRSIRRWTAGRSSAFELGASRDGDLFQRSGKRLSETQGDLPRGLLTQDNFDARLWRRLGTSRLARTVCAAPTGVANMTLYGKMPSVTYQDYPDAALIVLWGVNPQTSGIHLMPPDDTPRPVG